MIPAKISSCRLCRSTSLRPLFSLGTMAYTGIFPKMREEEVPRAPLDLIVCGQCGLVQLAHNADPALMFGDSYGYRSGLNPKMITHLHGISQQAQLFAPLKPGDLVLDIGSNDGTLLEFYSSECTRIGVDPTIRKFSDFYRTGLTGIPEFFTAKSEWRGQAKIITAIAMFYDLADPLKFLRDVELTLADDGVFILELASLPGMLKANAFDGICHEHLTYWGNQQLGNALTMAHLGIVDFSTNDSNGGSIRLVCKKTTGLYFSSRDFSLQELENWPARIHDTSSRVHTYLTDAKAAGKRVFGYGASTKGNVLLQRAGIGPDLLPCISEVNSDKFGRFTPGTRIPIISDEEARERNPDAFLVLPWHFRDTIIARERTYLSEGGALVFPLPKFEIVTGAQKVKPPTYEAAYPILNINSLSPSEIRDNINAIMDEMKRR